MRHHHDSYLMDDSGVKHYVEKGYQDPLRWHCDTCGTTNDRLPEDDRPHCMYCGKFRDQEDQPEYGWY